MIGDKCNSYTPPFLLTFDFFNGNVHKCLIDSRASSNIMSYLMCLNINAQPHNSTLEIVQLDRSKLKVLGEFKNGLIKLASNQKV